MTSHTPNSSKPASGRKLATAETWDRQPLGAKRPWSHNPELEPAAPEFHRSVATRAWGDRPADFKQVPARDQKPWGCKPYAPGLWGNEQTPTHITELEPALESHTRKPSGSEITLPWGGRSETKLPQDLKEREPETVFPWGCIPHPIPPNIPIRPRTYITKEWKGNTLHLLQEDMFYHFRQQCNILYTHMRAGHCTNLHLILRCISSVDSSNLFTILQHRVNEVVTSGTTPTIHDDIYEEGLHARLAPQFKWIGLSGSIMRTPFGIRFGMVSLRIKGLLYHTTLQNYQLLIEAVQVIETEEEVW